MALVTIVNGLCSAIGWSQPGMVSTGTNAEDTNVGGNIQMKWPSSPPHRSDRQAHQRLDPTEGVAEGEQQHGGAHAWAMVPSIRKPTANATPSITVNVSRLRTTSENVRPTSTASGTWEATATGR